MPLLKIDTNATIYNKDAVLKETSKAIAGMLGKPESYVMVVLNVDKDMLFAGDHQPCAFLQLKSLGLDTGATPDYSKQLCELMQDQLGIPPQRTYIEFEGPERHMWGWNDSTF